MKWQTLLWPTLLIGLVTVLFVWGAERQGRLVNVDMNTTDQDAYREYVKNLVTTDYQYVGDRNRMPVYPLLMSLFYRPAMSDEAFFATAKRVNTGLALLVLVAAFFLFRRFTPAPDAAVAILVTAFTVFAYRAPFLQAEVLFYGLMFALFALMLELILRPRWSLAALVGLIGALAQLTKASVLPAIGLGLACLLLRALIAFFQARRKPASSVEIKVNARQPWLAPLASAAIFTVVFLAVMVPYISTSKARFGHYFYNVNSTFYIWYDSWDEVKAGTRAHGDRVGWPDMPDEQIPSLGKYWREHTPAQIVERFTQGAALLRDMTIGSYGYAPFVLLYGVFVALLLWQHRQRMFSEWLNAERALGIFFVLAYFCGYFLLNAWYTRIAFGNRFVLALFLPALFTLVRAIGVAQRQKMALCFWKRELPAASVSVAVLLLLMVYLISIFPHQSGSMYGGL